MHVDAAEFDAGAAQRLRHACLSRSLVEDIAQAACFSPFSLLVLAVAKDWGIDHRLATGHANDAPGDFDHGHE